METCLSQTCCLVLPFMLVFESQPFPNESQEALIRGYFWRGREKDFLSLSVPFSARLGFSNRIRLSALLPSRHQEVSGGFPLCTSGCSKEHRRPCYLIFPWGYQFGTEDTKGHTSAPSWRDTEVGSGPRGALSRGVWGRHRAGGGVLVPSVETPHILLFRGSLEAVCIGVRTNSWAVGD